MSTEIREGWIECTLIMKASEYYRKALAQEANHGILFHEELHSVYGKGSQ